MRGDMVSLIRSGKSLITSTLDRIAYPTGTTYDRVFFIESNTIAIFTY